MKKKALLVNDSKFEAMVLRDMLNKLEYDVELADEFDAIYEVEKFNPDVVIVNYIMHETTGDQLIQKIKGGQPNKKCLLSSNNEISQKDKKIDGIIQTPISIESLERVLRQMEEMDITPVEWNEILEEVAKENRYCIKCNQDITGFGEEIHFCPYCGGKIKD